METNTERLPQWVHEYYGEESPKEAQARRDAEVRQWYADLYAGRIER